MAYRAAPRAHRRTGCALQSVGGGARGCRERGHRERGRRGRRHLSSPPAGSRWRRALGAASSVGMTRLAKFGQRGDGRFAIHLSGKRFDGAGWGKPAGVSRLG